MRVGATLALLALLYGGAAHAGNTSASQLSEAERAEFERLLPDDMGDFILHAEPRPFRDQPILDPRGREVDLHSFDGGVTVLNFWAIWCPPCRKELPSLDALQAALSDEGVRVVTVSVDRGGQERAADFLEDEGHHNLPPYWDKKSRLAKQMGVLGLPVTAILGPDGREIGRLVGEADWNSQAAKAMLRYLLRATAVGG